MDALTTNISDFFSSHLTGPSLAWYIFVILCIFVISRCRIVLLILCWLPLVLTILFMVFKNDIDRGLNRSTFFHDFSVGANIAETKDAPENSIAALKLALKDNNVVLFDVRMANDGAAVVIRDTRTGRTTEKEMNVAKTASTELVKLKFRDGEGRIPLFKEMMDECRKNNSKAVLRVHESSKELLAEISDYVRKHDLYSSVIVMSDHPTVVFFVKRHDPRILTGLSYTRFGASEHFQRNSSHNIFYKFLGQLIDDVMQIIVNTFLLPRFVGSDAIFLSEADVSLYFVKEAISKRIQVAVLSAENKTSQQWLREVAKIPYFTKKLASQKEE
ncbi:hypothetical protein RB195_014840 [Necator americanus]|uniref:GP-PDE domain-containing protein n=1 Tax=Necator americanus TaxID=51031 RepID=A0ABR1E4J4_NECAM